MAVVAESVVEEPRREERQPTTVTEALEDIRRAMLSVAIPDGKTLFIALIALAPLIVDTAARALGYGAPWPEVAWVFVYAAFAGYLMLTSRYVSRRLIADMGPRIDTLLDSRAASKTVAEWIGRVSPRWPQFAGCALLAGGVATAVGLVVHASTPNPPVRTGWLFAVFVAMFFAFDAASWVVRFDRLLARVGRMGTLAVYDSAPVQTPAVRELRDFSATLAMITGGGLFLFSAPLLALIIFVDGHGVDTAQLRGWTIVAFGLCGSIALYAAVAPQIHLALLVGAQRDRILDHIDTSIPKEDYNRLLCPEIVKQRELFNSIAATRTSTIGVTSVLKWALGLLAPALPFVGSWLWSSIGL